MKTLTHRHLRFTPADLIGEFGTEVGNKEWGNYVRTMLVKNGFDLSARIFTSGLAGFDCVLSQEL